MSEYIELLKKYKFDKQIKKFNKVFKDKKIVIYGSDSFFEVIKNNYDLTGLNIIGISDSKYNFNDEGKNDFGYKIIPRKKIVEYNPDVVLISTFKTFQNYKLLKRGILKNTKIKVYPMLNKSFIGLLLEAFSR